MKREPKENALQRIKDAEEFIASAEDNLNKNRFKAAVLDAGDAVMAANDAFTIFFVEERASSDHSEAIAIHKKAAIKINESQSIVLKNILDERHQYGYRSVQVFKNVAEKSVSNAKKFVNWVKEKIST